MVGDAKDVQPDAGGRANQVLGAHHPVARERVGMDLGEAEPPSGARV